MGGDENDKWVLTLNRYQRDNLVWLLQAVYGGQFNGHVPPFHLANTGDWVGELYWALADHGPSHLPITFTVEPNCTLDDLRTRIHHWLLYRVKQGDAVVPDLRTACEEALRICRIVRPSEQAQALGLAEPLFEAAVKAAKGETR